MMVCDFIVCYCNLMLKGSADISYIITHIAALGIEHSI